MNCFICGKEMEEDWYDGPFHVCPSQEPEHTFYIQDGVNYYFSFPEFDCHFEVDIRSEPYKFSTVISYPDKTSNNLKDMLYWTDYKDLIAYAKKVLTFQ